MSIQNYPKISIITASYNQGHYIEETINSITGQGYPNLEYIVIDGGSTDNTLEIIKKYSHKISFWVSEKDNGVCDAIDKGLRIATGDIMACINSDDLLHRKSLFTLAEIFLKFPEIEWLSGNSTVIDEQGKTVYANPSRSFTKYDFMLGDFQWIQLESTFWRRSLYEKAGGHFDPFLKLASDYDLWIRFFHQARLFITDALIGGFRARSSNQLSTDNMDKYLIEVESVAARQVWDTRTLKTLSKIENLLKIRFLLKRSVIFDHSRVIARIDYIISTLKEVPPKIYFDRKSQSFLF